MEDMSSTAVVEAYNRQVSADPGRTPLYLSALKAIGCLRGEQDKVVIDIAVQTAYEQGKYAVEDVVGAYQYFHLHFDDPNLTEDSIIGKFYAFINSTTQDTEARQQLWRIGDSRGSARIKAASEDRALLQSCCLETRVRANFDNRCLYCRTSECLLGGRGSDSG